MNHIFKLKDNDVKVSKIYIGSQLLNDNLDNENIIHSMLIIQQHISLFNRIKLLNLDNKMIMNRIIEFIIELYNSNLLEYYRLDNSTLISTFYMMSLKYLKLDGDDIRFYNKSNQELTFDVVNEYEYDDILRIGIVLEYLTVENMKLFNYIMGDVNISENDIKDMRFFREDGYNSNDIEQFVKIANLMRGGK
jgi:hypothetical protein